jgi:hypothetical protein
VLASLLPIALGHAIAVALVLVAVLSLGLLIDRVILTRLGGLILIGWAIWHALYGHRRRVRVGMQTGLAGLVLWSFLMASAHGAGLMLLPVLAICTNSPGGTVPLAIAALGLHTAVMLATIAVVALTVYFWVGVAFLRRGWINLDVVWVGALALCGVVLMVVA